MSEEFALLEKVVDGLVDQCIAWAVEKLVDQCIETVVAKLVDQHMATMVEKLKNAMNDNPSKATKQLKSKLVRQEEATKPITKG